jgi:predicted nucleic acid-binding protein
MDYVLDCSVALAWALPDEKSKKADSVFKTIVKDSCSFWVPALWWYELSNALTVAKRRERISNSDLQRLIELYAGLPLKVDPLLGREALWRFSSLASESNLSAYDAAYLELAQRKGLVLATLDQDLGVAAKKMGVKLV